MSVYLSVPLGGCLSARLHFYLTDCLWVFVSLPVCLLVSLSAGLPASLSWSLILYPVVVFFISVRTGLQRFKPLDPNAPTLGRILPDNTSLSSLSVGGVPRQKFLLITIMDKDVSLIFFQKNIVVLCSNKNSNCVIGVILTMWSKIRFSTV